MEPFFGLGRYSLLTCSDAQANSSELGQKAPPDQHICEYPLHLQFFYSHNMSIAMYVCHAYCSNCKVLAGLYQTCANVDLMCKNRETSH